MKKRMDLSKRQKSRVRMTEPVENVQEDSQTRGVVSLGLSSEEISEKQGRKKRVMKRFGLGMSKRLKKSKSGAPRRRLLINRMLLQDLKPSLRTPQTQVV